MGAYEDEPRVAKRLFLANSASLKSLDKRFNKNFIREKERWTETFYDTVDSSLSNAECILKTDSTAAQYWKFFCFAEDNIMEITTDEREIQEPLQRLFNFHSSDSITRDLLKPFFSINNVTKVYVINGCSVEVTETDYGFVFCRIESLYWTLDGFVNALNRIQNVAQSIGMKPMTNYEPREYITSSESEGSICSN